MLNNLVALLNGLAEFVSSRLSLAAQESKTALVNVLILVGCLVCALVMLAFGYVFLLVSAIFGIAHTAGISWVWIAFGAAGLHLVLAVVCLVIARMRLRTPMFESTSAELKKDREWLKNLDRKSLSTN